MILGQSLHASGTQFPCLQNGGTNDTCPAGAVTGSMSCRKQGVRQTRHRSWLICEMSVL